MKHTTAQQAIKYLRNTYYGLYFIDNFKIKTDTAKHRAIEKIIKKCDCIECSKLADAIINLNFTQQ